MDELTETHVGASYLLEPILARWRAIASEAFRWQVSLSADIWVRLSIVEEKGREIGVYRALNTGIRPVVHADIGWT